METLIKDIRYGVRSLLRRPGFVAIAVLTLALGIGANTAMFTVVNAVLLRPLAFPDSERIVIFDGINPGMGITRSNMSVPDFADWQKQNQVFEQMAGFVAGGVLLDRGEETERIRSATVTADFFPLLGTNALKGRTIQPEDTQPNREPTVVLSYQLWQRLFGSDEAVLGSKVTLSGRVATVVGIMPPDFDYPTQTEAWAPFLLDPAKEVRDNRYIRVITRLKPGVTIEQAQSEMDLITKRLAESYKETNSGWGVQLTNLRERLTGELRSSLLVLFGAVAFVLLIACANVANLLLARASHRGREMAVRAALGAGRLRIVRQLLTESVLLSAISGFAGLALSVWLTQLLIALSPANSPRFEEIRIDPTVFAFTFVLTLLTGILFGLAPALKISQTDLTESLKESGRQGTHGAARNRVGSFLLVSEVAFSFILLAGAGLLIKSFVRLREVDPGFNPNNVLTMRLTLPPGKYAAGQPRAQIYQQIVERVKSVPGVFSASAILSLPLRGDTLNVGRAFIREGRPATPEESTNAMYVVITPDYLQTLQIPLKAGRTFTNQDTHQTKKVVIVNEKMARQLWPGESPLGRKITIWRDEKFPREIVGVVGDTKASLDTDATLQMYVPYAQDATWGSLTLAVRTNGDPTALAAAVRSEIKALDKGVPLFNLKTMDEVLATSAAPRRTSMVLLGSFAGMAMLLAMLGIYGVTAYYVTQRTGEIGIRIALGAQVGDVLKLVLSRGMMLALTGIVIGLGGALALTRYLTTLLFDVKPFDAMTFALVSVGLVVVAFLACYLPARRAAKIDPLQALRNE